MNNQVELKTIPIQVKLVMIGNSGVGKTALIQRFIYNEFTLSPSTLGGFFRSKLMEIPDSDELIKFAIWDTAGQERFSDITKLYYKDAMAAIIVYDVQNPDSFLAVNTWLEKVRSETDQDLIVGIAANKCDLNEIADYRKAENFALENNAFIQKTSAKENVGVNTLFLKMAAKLHPVLSKRNIKYSVVDFDNPFGNKSIVRSPTKEGGPRVKRLASASKGFAQGKNKEKKKGGCC